MFWFFACMGAVIAIVVRASFRGERVSVGERVFDTHHNVSVCTHHLLSFHDLPVVAARRISGCARPTLHIGFLVSAGRPTHDCELLLSSNGNEERQNPFIPALNSPGALCWRLDLGCFLVVAAVFTGGAAAASPCWAMPATPRPPTTGRGRAWPSKTPWSWPPCWRNTGRSPMVTSRPSTCTR